MYNKVECVSITCDNCEEIFQSNHDGFSIFLDEGSAHSHADDDGWYSQGGKHYCANCHEINDEDELIIKPKPQIP